MKNLEKLFIKEEILLFNENEWISEISSGYIGYRNTNADSPDFDKWIYLEDYNKRITTRKSYFEDYELIIKFRTECLPFGEYSDYIIQDFLNKKYFK